MSLLLGSFKGSSSPESVKTNPTLCRIVRIIGLQYCFFLISIISKSILVNFAVFNFADCCVTVGAALLIIKTVYDLIRENKKYLSDDDKKAENGIGMQSLPGGQGLYPVKGAVDDAVAVKDHQFHGVSPCGKILITLYYSLFFGKTQPPDLTVFAFVID